MAVGTVTGTSFVTLSLLIGLIGAVSRVLVEGATLGDASYTVGLNLVLGTLLGLYVTAGIPVILTVGVALLLAELDPGEADGGAGRWERRDPGNHVRPPR